MRKIHLLALSGFTVLIACAETEVTPISKNEIILTTSASAECGASGAAKVASQMAAIETIRRGFERYLVVGANSDSNISAVTTGPTYANTTGSYTAYGNSIYGSSSTYFGGQQTWLVGTYDRGLAIRMFNKGDRGFSNAVDAKMQLGADWATLVEEGINTCTG